MSSRHRDTRRAASRRSTFATGFIAFGACPKNRILCFIRDISRDGAQIELCGEVLPPPRFVLEATNEPGAHNASVVWREGRRLGVTFRESAAARVMAAAAIQA